MLFQGPNFYYQLILGNAGLCPVCPWVKADLFPFLSGFPSQEASTCFWFRGFVIIQAGQGSGDFILTIFAAFLGACLRCFQKVKLFPLEKFPSGYWIAQSAGPESCLGEAGAALLISRGSMVSCTSWTSGPQCTEPKALTPPRQTHWSEHYASGNANALG